MEQAAEFELTDSPESDECDDDEYDAPVGTLRERAEAKLNEIVAMVRASLDMEGIDEDIFFILPRSGKAVMTFGTTGDPPDDEWSLVSTIVLQIVRQTLGSGALISKDAVCAQTHSALNMREITPDAV